MGFFALTLRFLSPIEALFCAFLAFVHNLYIFPLYGRKKIEKEEEKIRKYSAIVSYPLVVFFLILIPSIFLNDKKLALSISAASWAILAFGDSFASIVGLLLPKPKLFYNKDKTVSGFIAFFIISLFSSQIFFNFVFERKLFFFDYNLFIFSFIASLISAVVETIKEQFDDNISFPFIALSLFLLYAKVDILENIKNSLIWLSFKQNSYLIPFVLLMLNLFFALLSYYKKWVDINGFWFGLLIGVIVISIGGIKSYFILILFFVLANFSTFIKRAEKIKKGIYEENMGRRGIKSVFSKGLAPLTFSLYSFDAFFIALSLYASDTIATEIGKISKQKPVSLISFKKVEHGASGGVSLYGTISGLLGIIIFNGISLSLLGYDLRNHLLSVFNCTFFFLLESLVNDLNTRFKITNKVVIHIVLGFLCGSFYVLIKG